MTDVDLAECQGEGTECYVHGAACEIRRVWCSSCFSWHKVLVSTPTHANTGVACVLKGPGAGLSHDR
jgi:hypothetical protein